MLHRRNGRGILKQRRDKEMCTDEAAQEMWIRTLSYSAHDESDRPRCRGMTCIFQFVGSYIYFFNFHIL